MGNFIGTVEGTREAVDVRLRRELILVDPTGDAGFERCADIKRRRRRGVQTLASQWAVGYMGNGKEKSCFLEKLENITMIWVVLTGCVARIVTKNACLGIQAGQICQIVIPGLQELDRKEVFRDKNGQMRFEVFTKVRIRLACVNPLD